MAESNKDPNNQPFPLLDPYADTEAFQDPRAVFQGKNHRILSRDPGAREVGEGEIVFSLQAGVRKLHTKIKGIVVSAVLT